MVSTVLVTGVNGFLGSHVVHELMQAGYRVRGTVRAAKIDALRTSLGNHYPLLELIQVDDLATGDLSEALKGVDAIVHVASPLAHDAAPEVLINSAAEGTLNVLRHAVKADIKKVVITSSWGTTYDRNWIEHLIDRKELYLRRQVHFCDADQSRDAEMVLACSKDWGNVTREQALDGTRDSIWVYLASKILAERAAWDFAKENPSLDLATVLPPTILGPYVPHFPYPTPQSLGSNGLVYLLLSRSDPPLYGSPFFCDVRDIAQVHVLALKAAPLPRAEIEKKRFLVCGAGYTNWREAAKHLRDTRPETLKSRILEPGSIAELPGNLSTIDTSRAKELLGKAEYIGWIKTLDDTTDSLLQAEKTWAQA